MTEKKDVFNLEISDILEPEQEDFVIENIQGFVNKSPEALKEYFETTDTIEVKKLSRGQAQELSDQLKSKGLTVRVYNMREERQRAKPSPLRCPRCRFVLDFQDWRCPECYYEFPDYVFEDEDEPGEGSKE